MYKWIGLNKIEVLIFTDQENVIPTMCATVLFELTSSVSSIPLNLKSTPNTNEFTFTDHTYAITFTHHSSFYAWMNGRHWLYISLIWYIHLLRGNDSIISVCDMISIHPTCWDTVILSLLRFTHTPVEMQSFQGFPFRRLNKQDSMRYHSQVMLCTYHHYD